jgi:hypothetical protein
MDDGVLKEMIILNLDVIEHAATKLIARGIASLSVVCGCSDLEIQEIERLSEVKLPLTYRQFLEQMGKSTGDFLAGTDYHFPDLLQLRQQAERLLQENKAQVSLSREDFVFAMHQGYQFLFFETNISDDPAVFLYEEDEQKFKKVCDHFSEWLVTSVEDEVASNQASSHRDK